MAILTNPSALEPFAVYKFVKIGGDYLFAKQGICGPYHREILGDKDKSNVEAAGMITTMEDTFVVSGWDSPTLGVDMGQTEIDEIKEMIGWSRQ